jgi:ABC-2 type transport system ATP-binding protein
MPDESGQTAVAVEGLLKRFPDVCALDHLSFAANQGEIFGLVGPDGAGKTTTLRILAAIMRPDAGTARVGGLDVVQQPDAVKNQIAYMPQRFGLYEDLSVDENIRFYSDLFSVSRHERDLRASRLLSITDMDRFRHRLAGQLSGGMKQKLGLVCALIHRPKILMLDEPTNGVDPVSRREFWEVLYSLLAEGVTILASTAYLDEAERCHRVLLLYRGRSLYCDTPAQLKKKLPGEMVAIVSTEPRRLREELQRSGGVMHVILVGDGFHLLVDDAERRIPELRARLMASHLPFDRVARATPTLEDLLVTSVEAGKAEA